jgi:hypothetical protein
VWKEKKETLERKREGVCIELLFNLSKPFIVEIKPCVLSPLSVSKPPPVVSPTNILDCTPQLLMIFSDLKVCRFAGTKWSGNNGHCRGTILGYG